MPRTPASGPAGLSGLYLTFTALAGLLLLAFLLPLLAFLPDLEGREVARQLEQAGLMRSVAISGASATLATLLAAIGGIPLGFLLARDRLRFPWLIRTLVLVPLVLPPVAAGVLLLNVYGPGGLIGSMLERAGWTLVNAFGGIIVAQVFITAPIVVVTAEAAFRAVDSRLEAVGATLGRRPGQVFRRISLPLARYGLLAGLALAWMRAAGEFGATVVLAYHPKSLPVHLWTELTGRGLRAALPVTLASLLLASAVLILAQRFAARTRNERGSVRALHGPARPVPPRDVSLSPAGEREVGPPLVDARFTLRRGEFQLTVDLEARQEILSLFGPSGAGKSTLLAAIAGLAAPDSGRIDIDGTRVVGDGATVPPERRPIGLVLQEPSLFPHLSVRENVLFGADGPEAGDRFRRLVAVTRLDGLESRYPHELSGGQQQRVALARALMRRPRVLLLDEPFSSLDTNMRERLHRDVKRLRATFGLCVIYVTHELRDACAMGDRIAVISDGRIEQIGEPLAVIRRPATYDVARFVGVRNLFEGVVRAVDEGCVHVSIQTEPRAGTTGATDALEVMAARDDALAVGDHALAARDDALTVGQRVHVCVRPEDFDVADASRAGSSGSAGSRSVNAIRLTVRDRQLRGATYTLEGWAGASDLLVEAEVSVRTYEALDLANRREVMVVVAPEAVHLIPDVRTECDDGRSTVV